MVHNKLLDPNSSSVFLILSFCFVFVMKNFPLEILNLIALKIYEIPESLDLKSLIEGFF